MKTYKELASCEDCDNYIFDLDYALKGADGVIRCKRCFNEWLKEDWVTALEWAQTAEITNGERLSGIRFDEERVVWPRGRDIA